MRVKSNVFTSTGSEREETNALQQRIRPTTTPIVQLARDTRQNETTNIAMKSAYTHRVDGGANESSRAMAESRQTDARAAVRHDCVTTIPERARARQSDQY